jgi:adenosylcobinamide kinase/adenosylcobinamide-phosphate guanylyltransferase
MVELIIGGARSGKSSLAESQALADGRAVIYVATGQARDAEMAARIAHHQARRPASWGLIEAPQALAAALSATAREDRVLLIDCLTLWLSNVLLAGWTDDTVPLDDGLLESERTALLDALPTLPGRLILVSNEVGCGIVPLGALNRRFADEQGRLNQAVAALAKRVTLVAAGLPLQLKG